MGVLAGWEQAVAILEAEVAGFDPAVLSGADAATLVEVMARGERLCAAGKALAARRVAETRVWPFGSRDTPHAPGNFASHNTFPDLRPHDASASRSPRYADPWLRPSPAPSVLPLFRRCRR